MSKEQTPITAEGLRITDASSRKILSVHQSHTIAFFNKKGDIVGTLDFNGDRIKFNGCNEHSAEPFIEFITNTFNEKIRTDKEQYAQAKILEALEDSMTIDEVRKVCSQIFLAIGDGGDITTNEAIETVLRNRSKTKV